RHDARPHRGARRRIHDGHAVIAAGVCFPPREVLLVSRFRRIDDLDVRIPHRQRRDDAGEAELVPFPVLVEELARGNPVRPRRGRHGERQNAEHDTAAHHWPPGRAKFATPSRSSKTSGAPMGTKTTASAVADSPSRTAVARTTISRRPEPDSGTSTWVRML